MKTKNNVQKTILRSVAVITSFVLLSLTVGAQGYWRQLLTNNSFNEIAIAMVDNSPEAVIPVEESSNDGSDSYNYLLVNEAVESGLELENWMTGSLFFGEWNFYFEANDGNLNLESWMLDENYFGSVNCQEKSLALESWMTRGNLWDI